MKKLLTPETRKEIKRHRVIYLFLVPAFVCVILFNYIPIMGNIMAFQDYDIIKGFSGSEFVGLKWFKKMFADTDFWHSLKNTLGLNGLSILFGFPLPIALAITIFSMKDGIYKRVTQTISYLPHFISWVVVGGLVAKLLDQNTGAVNTILSSLGFETIPFMREPGWFWPIFIIVGIWKELGWNTIIYLAALSGIDAEQYEAAYVDGASSWQRLIYITIPNLMPTIGLMLIFTIGNLVSSGGSASFDAIYNLRNSMVASASDTLDYYVFNQGIMHTKYSYAAAIGLVQGLVSLGLISGANAISRKTQGYGAF